MRHKPMNPNKKEREVMEVAFRKLNKERETISPLCAWVDICIDYDYCVWDDCGKFDVCIYDNCLADTD